MRSSKEIIKKIKSEDKISIFNFVRDVLCPYLSYKDMVENFNPKLREETWVRKEFNKDEVLKEMERYMGYTWSSGVLGHNELKVLKSIDMFKCWLWLLQDDQTLKQIAKIPHKRYEGPIFKYICDIYDFMVPGCEEGRNMMEGDPCMIDCKRGCYL